jgi:hypothetical protein
VRGGASGRGYNPRLSFIWINAVEAERLNLIETTLNDLARRANELRGYL